MPSLTEELEQAQKERFEAETKLHQDLSDAERKATGNRVKELKAQEREINNLRKKALEEEKKAIENRRKDLAGISDSLANTQSNLVSASKASPISKMMTFATTLLAKIDKSTSENVKLQKGDLFEEEKSKEQLQRDKEQTDLLKTIAENTELQKAEKEKKKGGFLGNLLKGLSFLAMLVPIIATIATALAALAIGFVAGLGITLFRFVRWVGKLLFGKLFKTLGTLFKRIWDSKWIKNIRTFFTNIATRIKNFVKGKWTKWIDDIGGWFRKIGSKIDDVTKGKFAWLDKIRDFFRMVGGKVGKLFKIKGKFTWVDELFDFLGSIGRIGAKVGGKVKGGIITSVMKVVDTVFDAVRGFFKMFGRLFGFFRKVGGVFTKFFKFGAKFGKILGPIGLIISIVDGVIQAVKGAFAGYKDGGFLGALKGGLGGLFKSIVGDIVNLGSQLIGWILGALGFEKLSEAFKSFDIMKYFDPALQIVTSLLMYIPNVLRTYWDGVKAIGAGIGNLAPKIWDTIKTGLVNVVPNIFGLKDWLAGKFGVSVEGAKEAAERRREKLAGIAQLIKGNILARMPDVFGLREWLAEKWGITLKTAGQVVGQTQKGISNIGQQIKEAIANLAFRFAPAFLHGRLAKWFDVAKPSSAKAEPTKVEVAEEKKKTEVQPEVKEEKKKGGWFGLGGEDDETTGDVPIVNVAPDARVQEINANSAEITEWKNNWTTFAKMQLKFMQHQMRQGSPTVINNTTSVASTNQGLIMPIPAHDTTAKTSMQNGKTGTRP